MNKYSMQEMSAAMKFAAQCQRKFPEYRITGVEETDGLVSVHLASQPPFIHDVVIMSVTRDALARNANMRES